MRLHKEIEQEIKGVVTSLTITVNYDSVLKSVKNIVSIEARDIDKRINIDFTHCFVELCPNASDAYINEIDWEQVYESYQYKNDD